MPIDLDIVGRPQPVVERSWTVDDAILYALSVGAGAHDPTTELEFTTENTPGQGFRVLPTYLNVLARFVDLPLGDVDRAHIVHAQQSFELSAPLPTSGHARSVSTVTDVEDLDRAALVHIDTEVTDAVDSRLIGTTRATLYVKGAGGFGGHRKSTPAWQPPDVEPQRVPWSTNPGQALLYRLTGDRNPLHTDPGVAKRGGFDRPILHGMCVYGIAGRAVLGCSAEEHDYVSFMSGRFSSPVLPGASGDLRIWTEGSHVWFQVVTGDDIIIDRGEALLASSRAITPDGQDRSLHHG